jgi:glycosyltransferase involved in cell wall biosynthesis
MKVDKFLATSPIMADLLASNGFPRERFEWRPAFTDDHGASPVPANGGLVFVGRLDEAKGVRLLLDAWTPAVAARWERLTFVGDGPLRDLVRSRAATDASVFWTGPTGADGVRRAMQRSAIVALPSLCLEGFPLVAAEAMSLGRPLLMCDVAGFSRLSSEGLGWSLPADASAWSGLLVALETRPIEVAAAKAREFYERNCSPAGALTQLMRVYHEVLTA